MEFREEVVAFLSGKVAELFGQDASSMQADTRFSEDLNLKSVDIVRITTALEDEYEVEVPFMAFSRNKTFRDAAEYIAGLLGL